MDITAKFLSLPLTDQRRIIKATRRVSRVTQGIVNVDYTFNLLVEVTHARRENLYHDQLAAERKRFA